MSITHPDVQPRASVSFDEVSSSWVGQMTPLVFSPPMRTDAPVQTTVAPRATALEFAYDDPNRPKRSKKSRKHADGSEVHSYSSRDPYAGLKFPAAWTASAACSFDVY